jgi:hypothetical protein
MHAAQDEYQGRVRIGHALGVDVAVKIWIARLALWAAALVALGACGHKSVTSPKPAARQTSDVRAELARLIEREVLPLVDAPDGVLRLDRYLEALEARARVRGAVTALDVEPGFAAIRALEPRLGADHALAKTDSFSQRMTRLSAELKGHADRKTGTGGSQ